MPVVVGLSFLILPAIRLGSHRRIGRVLARYGAEQPALPGTGRELAGHRPDAAGLRNAPVEVADAGDHCDPQARAVRLLALRHEAQHRDGRSVATVAVAAHEVSHAVQHARGERAFAPAAIPCGGTYTKRG